MSHNAIITQTTGSDLIEASVDLYMISISNRLSSSTVKVYERQLRHFKEWFLSTPMRIDLPNHLQQYRAEIIEQYGNGGRVNFGLTVVRSLYKFLYETGLIDHDPTLRLKNVKEVSGCKRSALSRDQLSVIIHHLNRSTKRQASRDRVIFLLLAMNGLRVSELTNLRICDIDQHQGKRVAYLLRKGHIDRSAYVILREETYSLLMDFIGDRTEGFVFLSERTGGQISSGTVSHIIKGIYRGCGYDSKSLTAHSLRHTYAILALEGGASITGLMRSMNHKNISTTTNYLHSYDRITNSAEEAVSLDFNA